MATTLDEPETLSADRGPGRSDRKRMTIFRGSEAAVMDEESMPFVGVDEGVMAGFAKLMANGATPGAGEQTKILFREPGEEGLSLSYGWFKSGYILPRHSHNADCVYYVLAGELQAGSATLRKGDGIFVPAEHGYSFEAGPEGVEFIEFRNATHFNMFFKGNDEAHWDRIAGVYQAKADVWPDEVPPSA
jgi:mannose-6-phosphate isomerase-like protein (cupin superfamily)